MPIDHLLNNLLPSIEHFRVGGYWVAFFAALLETTIGIGLLLPGSTIILFLGAYSARGYLDIGDLIWFAVLGAIIGDNVNYYLGRKYGAQWLKDGFWLLRAEHIEKAKAFMNAHGAKSIFLGRFIPSVKEIVPFVAGSVKMNQRTFMFWNILGAVGWGFEWVFAGYLFAQSLKLAELWLSRAGLFFAVLLICFGILYFLKWLIVRKGQKAAILAASLFQSVKASLIKNEHVLQWLQKNQRGITFLKARFDKTVFSGQTLSILTVTFIYVLALLAGVVEDLITADPIMAADLRIANLFVAFRTHGLTNIFTWITLLGKSQVILVFIFIAVSLLWLWRKKYCILSLLIAVAGSEAVTSFGKLVFHRARPATAVYAEQSFSFPSGHATIAVAFYGFAAYLLIRAVQGWRKKVNIFFAAFLLITAIGFSRVYLGVHYISDVWSGFLVGGMWLIIAISFSEWRRYQVKSDGTVAAVGGARPISVALVFTGLLFYAGFALSYQLPPGPAPSNKTEIVSDAIAIFTNEHMKYTESLTGEKREPINYIFLAKDDNALVEAVQQAGWILTDKANVVSFVKAIKALILKKPHPSAPISPAFWNMNIQDFGLSKVPGLNWLSNAHHIKIWRTNHRLENGKKIYVSLVSANYGFRWGIIPQVLADLDTERERLYLDLKRMGKIDHQMKVALVRPLIGKNFMGDQFFSDGKAYIISLQ